MDFCISKKMLGIPANIALSDGKYIVTHQVPKDFWVVGDSKEVLCADTLCKIYGAPMPKIYSESEQKTFEILGRPLTGIPWYHVLGLDVIKERIATIARHLEDSLDVSSRKLYNNIYIDTRRLLCSLHPAQICTQTLDLFLKSEANPSLKTCLETFRPKGSSYAKKVIYNQSGTSTGRLTVKSGPSILTLPARYRSIVKSEYPDGQVLSIDFKSLEPRVALSVRSKSAPTDIYTHIAANILGGKITRKVAKLATIAALYGISFKKFKEMSGCDNREILDKVKDYFAVKSMNKDLLSGKFKNYWGRPLDNETLPHVRISHFIQSTSCDVVNVGFWKFLKLLKTKEVHVKPLFVLHDALIIDVPGNNVKPVWDICKSGIETQLGNFPITCEKF